MTLQCSLCGADVTMKECSCAMGDHCTLQCCPRCGYKSPGESSLTRFLRQVFKIRTTAGPLPAPEKGESH
jgi:hypothetical protein